MHKDIPCEREMPIEPATLQYKEWPSNQPSHSAWDSSFISNYRHHYIVSHKKTYGDNKKRTGQGTGISVDQLQGNERMQQISCCYGR